MQKWKTNIKQIFNKGLWLQEYIIILFSEQKVNKNFDT